MTFFTFLRFTKQQNMLQQQLKEATVGTKTLKAQPYLELKRIYTGSNSQSNELLLLDAMCQEHQSYLGLKDISCFKANGYAVVLFYYILGVNFASLCLGVR